MAYSNIPAWVAVATDWQTKPTIHCYDSKIYKGHADFVNRGLGRKIMFPQFKNLVKSHEKRQYIPFFIYDLRKKPFVFERGQGNVLTYNWAIRLEDYEYDDSPEELAATIQKLHDLVRTEMPFLATKGLIVLSNGGTNNFNITKLKGILKLSSCTLQGLMNHCKSAKTEILNEMPAFGKLIEIKNEKELLAATYNDVVILDFIPQKMPPVAGIITLVPQTPLSHVNLLAKNRGTLNLYTENLAEIPHLQENIGKYVRISVNSEQLAVSKITVRAIREQEAKAENEKRKPKPLAIPTPKIALPLALMPLNKRFILSEKTRFWEYAKPEYVGAKAANYAFLIDFLDEKYIQPAFVFGFSAYQQTLKESGAEALIKDLYEKKGELSALEIQAKLQEIRNLIQSHESNAYLYAIKNELKRFYASNTKIRLRSSTNCEDLPNFNGAGLYLSQGFYLNEADGILALKILEIYASLWTWEAFQEREYYGIDHTKAAMAILIHAAFSEETANGVILTQPQANGEIAILVNVQSGDNPIVSPENEAICEAFFLDIKKKAVGKILSKSSIKPVFVENEVYSTLLPILQAQVLAVHQHFIERQKNLGDTHNYGVDIEFKITKEGEFYIKQARLLTEVLPE